MTEVVIQGWRDLSDATLSEWQELQIVVHGPPEQRQERARLVWAPLDPDDSWLVAARADGRLVSGLVLITRTVSIGGVAIRVGAVRGVVTHPAHRRRRFGRTAMRAATAFAWDRLDVSLLVLLSSAMAVPFYHSLGWREVAGPVRCQQPAGEIVFGDVHPEAPAVLLADEGVDWPTGDLDLGGLPF